MTKCRRLNIIYYYRVRLTVHRSFQHHVVVGVRQHRSPEEVKQDWFPDRRYCITC